MDDRCEAVDNSDSSDKLELCDLIEYEKDGVKHLAYYIGDGCFYLLEQPLLATDGGKGFVPSDESIDVKQIIEFKDIVDCKCKILREKIEWRMLEDGDLNIKEHDIIEVDYGFRIRHFAICSKIGYAVDLNPKNLFFFIGCPQLSSCVRPNREGDNFGIESGDIPKFPNGEIREREINDVIKGNKYRIRSDQILVDIKRSTKNRIHYLKPLETEELRERISKAVKQAATQYNFCLKNCEHFVMWLKHGMCLCSQTQRLKDKLNINRQK